MTLWRLQFTFLFNISNSCGLGESRNMKKNVFHCAFCIHAWSVCCTVENYSVLFQTLENAEPKMKLLYVSWFERPYTFVPGPIGHKELNVIYRNIGISRKSELPYCPSLRRKHWIRCASLQHLNAQREWATLERNNESDLIRRNTWMSRKVSQLCALL